MKVTKCCNLRYIGENHNPIYGGVCRNCMAIDINAPLKDIIDNLPYQRATIKNVNDIVEALEDNNE